MRAAIAELGPRFEHCVVEPVTVGHSAATVVRLVDPDDGTLAYLKSAELSTPDTAALLAAETARLLWLSGVDGLGVRVPEVLGHGRDGTAVWLATRPLAGRHAASPWSADERAGVVDAVARGLRALHALDAGGCPFPSPVDPPAHVADQPTDRVVVHGDFCLPNVVIHPDGPAHPPGLLDLGHLGVGDRHYDLGLMVGSLTSARLNPQYGRAYAERFLDAYGRAQVRVDLVDAYRRQEWGPPGSP